MLCLAGGQPMPNLIPIYHYNPDRVIIAYTDTSISIKSKKGLVNVLSEKCTVVEVEIPAYDLKVAKEKLVATLDWIDPADEIYFNITGGTKLMSFAAIQLAFKNNTNVIYLDSDNSGNRIYHFESINGELSLSKTEQDIVSKVTIKDFLKAHNITPNLKSSTTEAFEKSIFDCLNGKFDEIMSNVRFKENNNVEIDVIVRNGSQFAIGEITAGKNDHKRKIDQINSASSILGAYTKKFMITNIEISDKNPELASAYNIELIYLNQSSKENIVSDDSQKLIDKITSMIGARKT